MIEMSVVVFILVVVLFLVIAFAAFFVGMLGGMYYQRNEDEKRFNSTGIFKLEK